jgi:hypothetical protein
MNRIDFIRDKLLKLHNVEIKVTSQEDLNLKTPAAKDSKTLYV